jgi:hypothetical protein
LRDSSNWPDVGDKYEAGKKTYIVDKVIPGVDKVRVHLEGAPEVRGSLPLSAWTDSKGAQNFVSQYAKKHPDENFAEMFDHYVEGTLPDDQVSLFEAILS